jgi:hypothetical protein
MAPIGILLSAPMISTALSPLTFNGFREDAAEDDPMHVMVRRDGPAGFPQLFLLDPDRNIIEINGAP